MSRFLKNATFPILIVVVLAFFAQRFLGQNESKPKPNFGQFLTQVKSGDVKSVTINTRDNTLNVTEADGKTKYQTGYPDNYARALAGEAGVPFFSISGSDFVEMFVGVGASRVRDLFEQAKQNSPCIIFMDEIDAVGRHRGAGLGGGHDEREQTLNQLLVEMDGFEAKDNIIMIAATNRPDILDPALLRPGRFDRQITVDRPDRKGRSKILEVHTRGKPLAKEIDVDALAGQTPGFTGADLSNLVNEAALLSARNGKREITQIELEEGIMRVVAGPEKKTRVMSEKERRGGAHPPR